MLPFVGFLDFPNSAGIIALSFNDGQSMSINLGGKCGKIHLHKFQDIWQELGIEQGGKERPSHIASEPFWVIIKRLGYYLKINHFAESQNPFIDHEKVVWTRCIATQIENLLHTSVNLSPSSLCIYFSS